MGQFWEAIKQAVELIVSGDPYVQEVILLSFRVSGSALIIALILGIPLGWWSDWGTSAGGA